HDCSEMGVVRDGGTLKVVYLRPTVSLEAAARRQPELVTGTMSTGRFNGRAVSYNQACGDPSYPVSGSVDISAATFFLEGQRNVLDDACRPVGGKFERLEFTKVNATVPAADPGPPQTGNKLTCPFALPAG